MLFFIKIYATYFNTQITPTAYLTIPLYDTNNTLSLSNGFGTNSWNIHINPYAAYQNQCYYNTNTFNNNSNIGESYLNMYSTINYNQPYNPYYYSMYDPNTNTYYSPAQVNNNAQIIDNFDINHTTVIFTTQESTEPSTPPFEPTIKNHEDVLLNKNQDIIKQSENVNNEKIDKVENLNDFSTDVFTTHKNSEHLKLTSESAIKNHEDVFLNKNQDIIKQSEKVNNEKIDKVENLNDFSTDVFTTHKNSEHLKLTSESAIKNHEDVLLNKNQDIIKQSEKVNNEKIDKVENIKDSDFKKNILNNQVQTKESFLLQTSEDYFKKNSEIFKNESRFALSDGDKIISQENNCFSKITDDYNIKIKEKPGQNNIIASKQELESRENKEKLSFNGNLQDVTAKKEDKIRESKVKKENHQIDLLNEKFSSDKIQSKALPVSVDKTDSTAEYDFVITKTRKKRGRRKEHLLNDEIFTNKFHDLDQEKNKKTDEIIDTDKNTINEDLSSEVLPVLEKEEPETKDPGLKLNKNKIKKEKRKLKLKLKKEEEKSFNKFLEDYKKSNAIEEKKNNLSQSNSKLLRNIQKKLTLQDVIDDIYSYIDELYKINKRPIKETEKFFDFENMDSKTRKEVISFNENYFKDYKFQSKINFILPSEINKLSLYFILLDKKKHLGVSMILYLSTVTSFVAIISQRNLIDPLNFFNLFFYIFTDLAKCDTKLFSFFVVFFNFFMADKIELLDSKESVNIWKNFDVKAINVRSILEAWNFYKKEIYSVSDEATTVERFMVLLRINAEILNKNLKNILADFDCYFRMFNYFAHHMIKYTGEIIQ